MKEDFEKNIKNKLSDFKIEPAKQVWLDVEDALQQRTNKKMAAWWWITLPVLFFLISGSIWWMNSKTLKTSSKTMAAYNLKNIKSDQYKQQTVSPKDAITGANPVEKFQLLKNNKKHSGEIRMIDKNNNPLIHPIKDQQLPGGNHLEKGNNHMEKMVVAVLQSDRVNNKDTTFARAKSAFLITTKEGTTDSSHKRLWMTFNKKDSSLFTLLTHSNNDNVSRKKTANSSSFNKNILDRKADPTNSFNKNALMDPSKQKDSLFSNLNAAIKNDTKQDKKNKHQWFIAAAGGFITLKEGNRLFASNQNTSSSSPSNGVGNAGGVVSSGNNSLPAFNNGYTFEAGFGFSQSLNKNWEASAGLQYRYLQNRQYVGFDSLARNSALLYFSYIQSHVSITNYAHWLQLPVSLSYIFNPFSRYPLQLSGGGSIAWAFSEHWLIVDKSNTSYPYHYNSSLDNRFVANLQVGVGLNCNDLFSLSLLAEQSITTIHKNSTEKFYWQQFCLQISKPLHLSSHPNKKTKK